MKFAIIADIHGNMLALEAIVNDFKPRAVDQVLNLGDHVSGPLWPKETLDFLRRQDWLHIRGNHDRQLIEQPVEKQGLSDQYASQCLLGDDLNWFKALPASATLDEGLLLFHGSPARDTVYLLETVENGHARLATPDEIAARLGSARSSIILCGHTHIPRLVTMPDGTLIINPGSVGLPAYDDVAPEPHVMETGSPHARYAVLDNAAGNGVSS